MPELRREQNGKYVAVALIYDAELFQTVIDVLSRNRIDCQIEGSLSYVVLVPKGKELQAKEIIAHADELHGRSIELLADDGRKETGP